MRLKVGKTTLYRAREGNAAKTAETVSVSASRVRTASSSTSVAGPAISLARSAWSAASLPKPSNAGRWWGCSALIGKSASDFHDDRLHFFIAGIAGISCRSFCASAADGLLYSRYVLSDSLSIGGGISSRGGRGLTSRPSLFPAFRCRNSLRRTKHRWPKLSKPQ